MTAHFDSLVRIVTDVNSFDVSNDAAIGLLKGSGCARCVHYCQPTGCVASHEKQAIVRCESTVATYFPG